MISFEHTIQDDLGIHARPAGMICRDAKNYVSEIIITNLRNDKKAAAEKVFSLMTLGAKKGDTIRIEINGDDEEIAGDAFKKLIETLL